MNQYINGTANIFLFKLLYSCYQSNLGHTEVLALLILYISIISWRNTEQYQSSWELSCDRAAKVLRYFTDTKSLNPARFQAVGYGSYRPIADNNT
jgi:hypothetical protein